MPGMNHGDLRKFVTAGLYRDMERIINAKSNRRVPYFILVNVKPRYQGQPAVSKIAGGVAVQNPGVEMNIKGCICHTILTVLEPDRIPTIPQLGTMLWRIDNRTGEVRLCYSLPMDIPNLTEDSDNAGDVATIAADSARRMGVPLFFN